MNKYERLTKRRGSFTKYYEWEKKEFYTKACTVYKRLQSLENKIELGYLVELDREVPKKRFQGRCGVCDLDLIECDWGNEQACLSDDLEHNFKYCPRCGQRIDWKGDDFYDNYKEKIL